MIDQNNGVFWPCPEPGHPGTPRLYEGGKFGHADGKAHFMPVEADVFEKLRLELRRGSLVLAVLAALKEERYGYTLRKVLADGGLEIDEGALYPMLRRLETQGLLTSEWREEDKRNKRFYRLSADGAGLLNQLAAEWRAINQSLNSLL